jgi:hypothetical protein
MNNFSRMLVATPEGLLRLFLDAGVSVEFLAAAFDTDAEVVETSLRDAIRKRDAILRSAPSSVELVPAARGAA